MAAIANLTNDPTERLAAAESIVRDAIETMSDDERFLLVARLLDGYCRMCLSKVGDDGRCWNCYESPWAGR